MKCLAPGLLTLLMAAAAAAGAEPVPVMVQSGSGRFEISAVDSALAHAVVAQADDAWRVLAAPLGLPEGFASPVYFRVVSAATGEGVAPFQVVAETGGIVSVRLRADATTTANVRRALVQGLLMRLAVARHGVSERLRVPLWLEEGCVGWWQTRAEAAQLDALRHGSAHRPPPPFGELLQRERGQAVAPEFSAAAVWLLVFFQAESGRAREWPALLNRLLAGEVAADAVRAAYSGRFTNTEERELWWQTGWHRAVRARSLPALDAAESRAMLGVLTRFVFSGGTEENDTVFGLEQIVARASEPIVAADLARRAGELGRLVTMLHPFYRNAGLSLAEAFAARGATAAKRAAACAAFERDWQDAIEIDTATSAALDAIEAGAFRR